MKRSILLIALPVILLAACTAEPVRNDSETTLDVQISSRVEVSSAPVESNYDAQDTMLTSEILDLYYYQLEAIKDGDAEDYLALYPPAYAKKVYPEEEDLEEYEAWFEKRANSFVDSMGEDVRLTLTVTDEAPVTGDDAKAYTEKLNGEYGLSVTVEDVRKFTFDYHCGGENSGYSYEDVSGVAVKIEEKWYLLPGTSLFF